MLRLIFPYHEIFSNNTHCHPPAQQAARPLSSPPGSSEITKLSGSALICVQKLSLHSPRSEGGFIFFILFKRTSAILLSKDPKHMRTPFTHSTVHFLWLRVPLSSIYRMLSCLCPLSSFMVYTERLSYQMVRILEHVSQPT